MRKVHIVLNNKTILVTGSPGFIGANLVLRLLNEMTAGTIISFDSMNDYYDPKLKEYRLNLIEKAAKTLEEIETHGENIYDEHYADSNGSITFELDSEALKIIREYNEKTKGEGDYLNISLTGHFI